MKKTDEIDRVFFNLLDFKINKFMLIFLLVWNVLDFWRFWILYGWRYGRIQRQILLKISILENGLTLEFKLLLNYLEHNICIHKMVILHRYFSMVLIIGLQRIYFGKNLHFFFLNISKNSVRRISKLRLFTKIRLFKKPSFEK